MGPNPSRKALSVVLLAGMVPVIECVSSDQLTSAWLVHALICELPNVDRLEVFRRPFASESLIRKGLSGLEGGHRLSDVAAVASALRKYDVLMCEAF